MSGSYPQSPVPAQRAAGPWPPDLPGSLLVERVDGPGDGVAPTGIPVDEWAAPDRVQPARSRFEAGGRMSGFSDARTAAYPQVGEPVGMNPNRGVGMSHDELLQLLSLVRCRACEGPFPCGRGDGGWPYIPDDGGHQAAVAEPEPVVQPQVVEPEPLTVPEEDPPIFLETAQRWSAADADAGSEPGGDPGGERGPDFVDLYRAARAVDVELCAAISREEEMSPAHRELAQVLAALDGGGVDADAPVGEGGVDEELAAVSDPAGAEVAWSGGGDLRPILDTIAADVQQLASVTRLPVAGAVADEGVPRLASVTPLAVVGVADEGASRLASVTPLPVAGVADEAVPREGEGCDGEVVVLEADDLAGEVARGVDEGDESERGGQ